MTPDSVALVLLRAKEVIRAHTEPERSKSTKTIAQYRIEWLRLLSRGDFQIEKSVTPDLVMQIIMLASQTRCLNTWYRRKAAISYSMFELVYRAHNAYLELDAKSEDYLSVAEKSIAEIENFVNCYSCVKFAAPPFDRQKKASKRKSIIGLDRTWMKKVVDELDPKYQIPAIFLLLTGCRPGELENPINLEISDNNGRRDLIIEIQGIKVTGYSGQKYRKLHYPLPSADPLVEVLAKAVQAKGGSSKVVPCQNILPNTLTKAIGRAADKLFGKRKEGVSAYSFRHQVASDLKASFHDVEQISMALGHRVTKTQGSYGTAQQGSKGATGMRKATGACTVRKTHKNPSQGAGRGIKRHSSP